MEERENSLKTSVFLSDNQNNTHRYNKNQLMSQIKGAIRKRTPTKNHRFQSHQLRNSNFKNNHRQGPNKNGGKLGNRGKGGNGNKGSCNNCGNNKNNCSGCQVGNRNHHRVIHNKPKFKKQNHNHNNHKHHHQLRGHHNLNHNHNHHQRNHPHNHNHHNHHNRNQNLRSLPDSLTNNKPLQNKDKMDIRFDLKGVQHRILCQKLEKEIINIVPRIIDSISDEVVDFAKEINEEQEHDKKMRERLHLNN